MTNVSGEPVSDRRGLTSPSPGPGANSGASPDPVADSPLGASVAPGPGPSPCPGAAPAPTPSPSPSAAALASSSARRTASRCCFFNFFNAFLSAKSMAAAGIRRGGERADEEGYEGWLRRWLERIYR